MLLLPWAVRSSGTLNLGVVVLALSGILIVMVETRVGQEVVGKSLVMRDRGGSKWMERLIGIYNLEEYLCFTCWCGGLLFSECLFRWATLPGCGNVLCCSCVALGVWDRCLQRTHVDAPECFVFAGLRNGQLRCVEDINLNSMGQSVQKLAHFCNARLTFELSSGGSEQRSEHV